VLLLLELWYYCNYNYSYYYYYYYYNHCYYNNTQQLCSKSQNN